MIALKAISSIELLEKRMGTNLRGNAKHVFVRLWSKSSATCNYHTLYFTIYLFFDQFDLGTDMIMLECATHADAHMCEYIHYYKGLT